MYSGKIYAIESMGLVDGPGIRVVVFFQGCSLRCKFCHNPDSQDASTGKLMSTKDIMDKIIKFRPYFERSGGGVTFSGGEPLLQKDFLLELLRECKRQKIHTCLDTSGVGIGDYENILSYTDLVLYDVKAIDNKGYSEICGLSDMLETQKFQESLKKSGVPVVIRQVVIPGVNDSDDYMLKLSKYIQNNFNNVIKVELLPYHKLGVHKYQKLGIDDPYKNIPAMDQEKTDFYWEKYFKNI